MKYHLEQIRQRRRDEGKEPGFVESGFTLIELLIVIVVLGILAAVVVFALSGVTASSAVSACNSDAKSVEVAIAAYNAQNGSMPANVRRQLTTTSGATQYLRTWPANTGTTPSPWTPPARCSSTPAGTTASVNYDQETRARAATASSSHDVVATGDDTSKWTEAPGPCGRALQFHPPTRKDGMP